MSEEFVIGVLGGMGTYATIHMFQQYAAIFPAVKEWERPRIIIDNRCTMPSRVLAFLKHIDEDKLVDQMEESLSNLANSGCTRIILACNTSHLFLQKIYEKNPTLEKHIVHLIHNCVSRIAVDGTKSIYLLGSEGTIESKIYQNALAERQIECIVPNQDEYSKLRECIEAVKQNSNMNVVKDTFLKLVNKYDRCILGCTELPIIYEAFHNDVSCEAIYDPLQIALETLKKEYDHE